MFFSSNVNAETNDDCPGEIVTTMNNITSTTSTTISGKVDGNGDEDDYYYFRINTAGTLNYSYTSDQNTDLKISNSSCNSDRVLNNGKSASGTLNVSANNNIYIRIKAETNTNDDYSLSISFTPNSITYTENADDICYEDVQQTGFCTSFMSWNCTTTFPIRNISNENLEDVKVIYKQTGMNGSMLSGCTLTPSGTCQDESNLDMGPFGMFGSATSFDFASAITPTQTTASIATSSMMSMDFFTTEYLYATYQKDGVYYRGAMSPCPEVSDGGRDFEIRNPIETRNIKGNLKVIGNTVLCYKNNQGVCQDTDSANNQVSLSFIDIDSNNYTFNNSSKAEVANVPNTAKIVWAGFYTQGYLKTTQTATLNSLRATPNYLTTPTGQIISLNTDVIDIYPYQSDAYTYSTFKEVKELIGMSGNDINGWFTGANIKALTGDDTGALGYFGAWSLVIIYEDQSETLKNISVFDGYKQIGGSNDSINVSGFLTPTSGDVKSTLSVFAGEGDKNIDGDDIELNDVSLTPGTNKNAFNSTVNGFNTNPNPVNYQGIDIHNYDVGVDRDLSHLQIIGNSVSSAKIDLITTGDYYYPSVVAFTTELYEPRVCYYIDTIKDQQGNAIFEDTGDGAGPRFTGEINDGQEYTYNIWISNMAQDPSDTNLETAQLVQVYMHMNNFDYENGTILMNNIGGATTYEAMSDSAANDLAEYDSSKKTATFRVGTGADNLQGGTLIPTVFSNNSQKAYIQFNGKIDVQGDASEIDLLDYLDFKASFKTDIVTISPENAQAISQCKNLDSTATVGGILGAFNVVNEYGGASDFDNPQSSQTYLVTQVANRPFNVKVISLNTSGDALQAYNGDVNVSLIQTPNYAPCGTDETCLANVCNASTSITTPVPINFSGTSSEMLNNFTYPNASKNVSFKISYNNGTQHACSLDSFAVRPNRFELSAPALMRAGQSYNISLVAQQYGTAFQTADYNVTDVNESFTPLQDVQIIYNPDDSDGTADLDGNLSFVNNPISITNGVSNSVGVSFNDVGLVQIKLQDDSWSIVDSGDTPQDCSEFGAFVCGEVNATFIPDHFTLSNVSLKNAENQTFTYFANFPDDINHSAKIITTLTAEKFGGGTTLNFKDGAWENNVSVTFTAPQVYGLDANRSEIVLADLNFTSGTTSILSNDTNSSKMLMFNYPREVNTTRNPVEVNGSDFTVNALSIYTNGGTTENVTGSSIADANATFIYGRTHAPRQRFTDSTTPTDKNALIYYEAYCHGAGCDKSLLPNGQGSTITDDPRWWVNSLHNSPTLGLASNVNEKSATNTVTIITVPTGTHQDQVVVNYDGSKGYPYITTMENNASSWLIHNPFNANASSNEFILEFYRDGGDYVGSGKSLNSVNIKQNNTLNVNENKSWW